MIKWILLRYNSEENKQKGFYTASKAISCLTILSMNNTLYLAAGERGHSPLISIWEVESGRKVCELADGHKHGVGCLSFSPDGKYLVSAGFRHDKQLVVWDWQSSRKLSVQRLGNKVNKKTIFIQ
jgi:WD40 repeat protein